MHTSLVSLSAYTHNEYICSIVLHEAQTKQLHSDNPIETMIDGSSYVGEGGGEGSRLSTQCVLNQLDQHIFMSSLFIIIT